MDLQPLGEQIGGELIVGPFRQREYIANRAGYGFMAGHEFKHHVYGLLKKRGKQGLLRGGLGADLFAFLLDDFDAKQDSILDFRPVQGDRLGINAALGLEASFAGEAWQWIGDAPFSGAAAQLRFADGVLSGDRNGDGRTDLNIALAQITSFDPAWIS